MLNHEWDQQIIADLERDNKNLKLIIACLLNNRSCKISHKKIYNMRKFSIDIYNDEENQCLVISTKNI